MKAFFIVPDDCPLERAGLYLALGAITDYIFFKVYPKFTVGDITFEKKINDEYYAQWMCAGCSKSIDGDCKFRKCGLGGKIVSESPGVKGYKITKTNMRRWG